MSIKVLTFKTLALIAISAISAAASVTNLAPFQFLQPIIIPKTALAQTNFPLPTSRQDEFFQIARSRTDAVTAISSSIVLAITTPSPMFYGQTVDGFAQVNAADNSPVSGTITFYDGAASICVIPVDPTVSCPTSAGTGFAIGSHILTAVYSGDSTHSSSVSNAASVNVLPAITASTLTSSLNPSQSGQSVVFTATLNGGYAVPSGMVTFFDGTVVFGTAMLDGSGLATLSVPMLAVGKHGIVARYSGDGFSAASQSAVFSQLVNASSQMSPASFTIVAGSISVGSGKTASVLVRVSPMNGFNQGVQLGCSDLPSEATCTFASTVIPAGGGTTTMQLSTRAPSDCGSSTPYGQTGSLPFAAPVFAGVLMLFLPKRRRGMNGLWALIAMVGLITMIGCGTCTDLGTRPGTYTIKVTGVSTGLAQTANFQKVQVTVGE